jgi:myo-inositol-1(or 4)-monophosphatase
VDACRLVDGALTVAGTAARAGGAVLLATDRTRLDVDLKDGRVDLTTSADRASQAAVVAVLRATFPEHRIVGEEGVEEGPDAGHVWYVDGLDGTGNFANGLPWYAVSVGLRCGGEVVAGAVFDPVHDELFAAGRGRGATGNGVPLRASATADLGRALVVTQIQSADPARVAQHAELVHALLAGTGGVRSPGAPALILAHIAAGHYAGYVERAMPPWDTTAGQLLLEEAGGRLTDLAGTRVTGDAVSDVVASNGPVHEALLELVGRPPGYSAS